MVDVVYDSTGGDDMLLFMLKNFVIESRIWDKLWSGVPGCGTNLSISVSNEMSKFVIEESGKLLRSYPEVAVVRKLSEGFWSIE
jgi:hypothetical protein